MMTCLFEANLLPELLPNWNVIIVMNKLQWNLNLNTSLFIQEDNRKFCLWDGLYLNLKVLIIPNIIPKTPYIKVQVWNLSVQ